MLSLSSVMQSEGDRENMLPHTLILVLINCFFLRKQAVFTMFILLMLWIIIPVATGEKGIWKGESEEEEKKKNVQQRKEKACNLCLSF